MIRRRHIDSYGAEQDRALRNALMAAAESVEPAGDGLSRIRSKIAEGQAAQRVRWRFGIRAPGEPWWRSLLPPRGWLPAIGAAVADRFRPDPNRAGWFGWLRPAAAIGTGLFVATAASWAVAALPAALSPSSTTGGPVASPGPTRTKQHHSKSNSPGFTQPGSGSVNPTGQNGGKGGGTAQPTTPSCPPSSSPSTTPSGTPSTVTPTDTPTDTSTPTDTPIDSGSPSPAGSTTSSPTPGSAPTSGSGTGAQPTPGTAPTPGAAAMAPVPAASPEATGKVLLSLDGPAGSPRQFGGEVVRATLLGGTMVGPGPNPLVTPEPTASPTVGGPIPTPPVSIPILPTPCQ